MGRMCEGGEGGRQKSEVGSQRLCVQDVVGTDGPYVIYSAYLGGLSNPLKSNMQIR